ncbi:DNA glycosylase [Coemansia reversa NRRL 1564]|uniref:DNA-(apurinic or apyrimidinic site) lyase n=1 Tax=Coemansia reversa (strain ATCC 12441 / NRRL 1564) TaxID=763665 RepID=A0A2G5BCH7_COERN|nr:DNA glycosylase [Coemansia reversa NRRL 1564]|eukprot:PIA16715.1 DNA glycosylase [Coemansia reversa NRRL 1564]
MTTAESELQAPSQWSDLNILPNELRLNPTLTCGQAFRWKVTGTNEWTCALWGQAVDLKQTPTTVLFRTLGTLPNANADVEGMLHDYFQLHVKFDSLCTKWSQVDSDFIKLQKSHQGVRTLRQPVVETLFTFIASSNNNIKRITMLVDKLCEHYGVAIDTIKGRFFTFPTIKQIATDPQIELTLKQLGFGYRAKYYANSIKILCQEHIDPEAFLLKLRTESLDSARNELLRLSGVGPKVADCVCLMALDKYDAVPIDTHIWQVAQRRYVNPLARKLQTSKTPTTKTYEAAQQLFIHLFSPYAGWAQGLLFSGDLNRSDKPNTSKNVKAPLKRKATVDPSPAPDIPSTTALLQTNTNNQQMRLRSSARKK